MVYNDEACYVLEYMAWMWREFLVFSAMRGSPVSAGEVIKTMTSMNKSSAYFVKIPAVCFLHRRRYRLFV